MGASDQVDIPTTETYPWLGLAWSLPWSAPAGNLLGSVANLWVTFTHA